MTDGTVNWLMGGYHMGTGTVSGNSVNVSGGTIKGSITGADSSGGDSINNTVVMSNVTVAVVRGGLAGDGIASGNSVTIESRHVTSHAFGGDGQKGSTDNEITLNADAVVDGHLFGGLARGVNAAATGNKVTITGGTVSGNTYGGKNEGSGRCDVSQNTVLISGGYAGQYVVGGYTPTGNATGNTIYMSNGKAGVINAGENDSGTISENTIVFNGGEVNYIQGGYSYSGSIINNKIFINGGTIHNNVLGGVVDTGDGVADNNEIIITGGIFEGDIYGGSAVNSASGNKVTLAGAPTISGHIYGGAGNVTTDNILTFGTSDLAYNGTFEGTFSNFDTLNIVQNSSVKFTDIDTNTTGGFTVTGTGEMTATNVSVAKNNSLTIDNGNLCIEEGLKNTDRVNVQGNAGRLVISATGKLDNQGDLTVSSGVVEMASGSSLSMSDGGKLTIDGGAFVADAGLLLTDSFTAKNENGVSNASIVGSNGNLNLRLYGEGGQGTYTAAQYNAAKEALLGQDTEGAALNFLNARLETGGADLVVGATQSDKEITISMAPVVVEEGTAPGQATSDQKIDSVPLNTVKVVAEDDDAHTLLKADTITIANSTFTAKGLEIDGTATEDAGAVKLEVTNGSNITLAGGEAGFTGVVAGGEAVKTDVAVAGGSSLTVGLAGNEENQHMNLNDVTVEDGTFAVQGNGLDTTQVSANTLTVTHGDGAVTVDNAALAVQATTVSDGLLSVTNSVVDLGTVTFSGGILFFDPTYSKQSFTDGQVGGKLLASDGSVVNVASGLDNLQELAQKAGFTTTADPSTGGFIVATGQSMLAIGQPIKLVPGVSGDAGQIIVDAGVDKAGAINKVSVPDAAYFGNNSLLVVNGNTINGNTAAIDINGQQNQQLNVRNGAKLLIADAVAGTTYTVISNASNANTAFNGTGYTDDAATGWKGANLLASSDMVTLTSTDGMVFTATGNDAHTVFPGLSHELVNAVNTLYGQKLNDTEAEAMGVRFLSRATDNRFLGADKQAAASTIESAARMAFASAVPQMTRMASDAATNAVVNRLGFANPADGAQAMNAEGKIVDRNTTGFALWIAPLWQNQHGWGMEAGNLDYGFNGNLGGVSLGADYTFENAIRAGITFNIGGGYAETSGGDLNSTENRMTFWGLGAYAGWNYENFGLMADVSYTSTWNQLEQDLDPGMGMGDLEADVQATAISAGLRAEYKLETSVLDIIPHVGVRYMSLNTWGYDVDANGGTVMEGDGFHQDIWTFPVGVTFSKDITLDSGWFFKPSVDFSVIPAAGDIKAREDVRFTGAPAVAEMETQMMDYLTWQGGVGVQLGNDNLSFGVNYTLQAGQHTTGHGVFGNFRYEF